jgi:hypothetical protein
VLGAGPCGPLHLRHQHRAPVVRRQSHRGARRRATRPVTVAYWPSSQCPGAISFRASTGPQEPGR